MSAQLQQRQEGVAAEGTGKEDSLHLTSQGKGSNSWFRDSNCIVPGDNRK